MIRALFIALIVVGALYLVRWFLKTPAESVAATIKKSAWFVAGIGLIALAATGRLHWLFAFLGAAIPVLVKNLPNLLRLIGLAKLVRNARANSQQNGPEAGPEQANQRASSNRRDQGMSREEALDVLGLNPGASREAIVKAHRELIQKLHPDRGGSTHLAAQINQAKRVLLGD